ncbi:MAG: TIGR04086 family membrane protein [Defluviitaleaceae bacterium]|nr:TIGR04086 family membrane protein [Defluviitaleaceae bacterium]
MKKGNDLAVSGSNKAVLKAGSRSRIMSVIMGVLIAYVITCVIFVGTALALTYTELPEASVPTIMLIAVAVSVVVAGFDAAKGAPRNGWLWGMAAGLIYAVILIIIETWISDRFSLDGRTVTSIALAIAGGGFGGILGINLRKK